jgi:hypothetical protein
MWPSASKRPIALSTVSSKPCWLIFLHDRFNGLLSASHFQQVYHIGLPARLSRRNTCMNWCFFGMSILSSWLVHAMNPVKHIHDSEISCAESRQSASRHKPIKRSRYLPAWTKAGFTPAVCNSSNKNRMTYQHSAPLKLHLKSSGSPIIFLVKSDIIVILFFSSTAACFVPCTYTLLENNNADFDLLLKV